MDDHDWLLAAACLIVFGLLVLGQAWAVRAMLGGFLIVVGLNMLDLRPPWPRRGRDEDE